MPIYPYRTCAEVNLNSLQENLKIIRKQLKSGCKIMQVLKADGYGHGARICSQYSAPFVDWFAVATFDEALTIRSSVKDTPILILGGLLDHELLAAAKENITINLFSLAYAQHVQQVLAQAGVTIDAHIKIDTGMNRLGFSARLPHLDDICQSIYQLYQLENIHITGTFTHFACADSFDEADWAFTDMQYQTFGAICNLIQQAGYDTGIRHCSSTGAILCHREPGYQFDMVRLGMLPLGQSADEANITEFGLTPVLNWYSRVIDIRQVLPGESVSYGRTHTFTKNSRVAVVSVGYADGYSRPLSNRSEVVICGKKAPILGRICMDFFIIDVSNLPNVEVGSQVLLLGRDEGHWISTNYLMERADADDTCGGITSSICGRVPRVYVYNDEVVSVRQGIL